MTSSITAPLEVRGLTKHFPAGNGLLGRGSRVHAVDDVTFALRPGTITALVGESGSGKSTVARLLVRLYDPTSGRVLFEGRDVTERPAPARRPALPLAGADDLPGSVRVAEPGQDGPPPPRPPAEDPRPRVRRRARRARWPTLLEPVGLVPAEKYAAKYPHELSGGQRQRVAIARALAVEPTVLVADEPTSMLDVSIRVGILNLMLDLKERKDLAFLYVTHDLASARYVADTVLVMYAGQIVEQGPAESVLQSPLHPYTRLLLASVPDPNAAARAPIEVRKGVASAAVDPPEGCRFVERCPLAHRRLLAASPPSSSPPQPAHSARCHVTAPSPAIREDIHVDSTHTAVPSSTSSGARRPRRTRSRAPRTKTAAARASGIASVPRPARCATATTARSRATSTTATATTSR